MKPTRSETNSIVSNEKYQSLRRRAIAFMTIICVGNIKILLLSLFYFIDKFFFIIYNLSRWKCGISGVAIAIGTLLYGHYKMISRGETSIEKHINNSERRKYALKNKVSVSHTGHINLYRKLWFVEYDRHYHIISAVEKIDVNLGYYYLTKYFIFFLLEVQYYSFLLLHHRLNWNYHKLNFEFSIEV